MGEVAQIEQTAVTTPADMLRIAVEQGADLDKMQQLMDLQERWEANEAQKAYVSSMNAFKQNPPEIVKNKHVAFGTTEYDHASLAHVVDAVCHALSEHGLSHRWDVQQNGDITVTCVITHQRGHSESVSMTAPADDSGKKNTIQQIASTVTYLQRYTLLSTTGLAAKDIDDDGHKASTACVTAEQAAELKKLLKETGSDTKQFLKMCGGIASVDELPAGKFKGALRRLESKQQLDGLKG